MSSNPATKGDNIVSLAYDLKDEATIGSVNNESAKKFTSTGFVNHVYKNNGSHIECLQPESICKAKVRQFPAPI